ncbi:MAG TPA: hypothetical protein VGI73_12870 [Solirubrobacterales bacterium]
MSAGEQTERRAVIGRALGLALLLAVAGSARAQTFTVTNPSDSGTTGDRSLRDEVRNANASAGPDTTRSPSASPGRLR